MSRVEPEYSEEARKAKYQGEVRLHVHVSEKGIPDDVQVIRPLGMGLDEQAVAAVRQWRFRPMFVARQTAVWEQFSPQATWVEVLVSFRLF